MASLRNAPHFGVLELSQICKHLPRGMHGEDMNPGLSTVSTRKNCGYLRRCGLGLNSGQATITVLGNPFEKTTLALKGEGYFQPILIHGCSGQGEDELRFPDTAPAIPCQVQLELENNSNKHFRCVPSEACDEKTPCWRCFNVSGAKHGNTLLACGSSPPSEVTCT